MIFRDVESVVMATGRQTDSLAGMVKRQIRLVLQDTHNLHTEPDLPQPLINFSVFNHLFPSLSYFFHRLLSAYSNILNTYYPRVLHNNAILYIHIRMYEYIST